MTAYYKATQNLNDDVSQSFHLLSKEEKKQIMTKNEIENLRESNIKNEIVNNHDNTDIDYSNFLTPEILLLKQLEKEDNERREQIRNSPLTKTLSPLNPADKTSFTNLIFDQSPKIQNTKTTSSNKLHNWNSEFQFKDSRKKLDLLSNYTKTPQSNLNNQEINKKSKLEPLKIYYCFNCNKIIENVILQAVGESYHPNCFRCSKCSCSLDGVPFVVDNVDKKRIFCMADYENSLFPLCHGCKMKITSINSHGQIVRVVFQDKEYHIECYICEVKYII